MPEIVDTNISNAWLRAVALVKSQPRNEIANLVVSIESIETSGEIETSDVRLLLNQLLEDNGNFAVETVANTIFPNSLWKKYGSRNAVFEKYLQLWPRISSHKRNRKGTYFQRLIAYPSLGESSLNQLEFVISAYKSGTRRRSALQCGILVPSLDLNATPYQGFPCLQQIAFLPEGRKGLRISALYPMHYLWARAYGNYLGLINLGRFMANEMGLELRSMSCIALVAKLDEPRLAGSMMEAANEVR